MCVLPARPAAHPVAPVHPPAVHDDRVRPPSSPDVALSPEVADALASGRPVVALESTLLAHGLPRPDNRAAADEVEAAVRAGGAVPATIAVLDGVPHVGLTAERGRPGLRGPGPGEAGRAGPAGRRGTGPERRDDGGQHGAARRARRASRSSPPAGSAACTASAADTFDESADLTALSRTSLVVVCAGVKSILDVPATLERLESLSVTVVGYRTTTFPGFYVADSGSDARLVGGRPGGGGGGLRRPPGRWHRARSSSPIRCRWTSSSTRHCTTG